MRVALFMCTYAKKRGVPKELLKKPDQIKDDRYSSARGSASGRVSESNYLVLYRGSSSRECRATCEVQFTLQRIEEHEGGYKDREELSE
jgi:hypothetical protein